MTKEPTTLQFNHVKKKLEVAFSKWLISKSNNDVEVVEDGLFYSAFIPKEIALDASSRKKGQRLLLDVEKDGVLRRAAGKRHEEELKINAKEHLADKMYHAIINDIQNNRTNILAASRLPAAFGDLIDAIYSPSTSYTSIYNIISAIPGLDKKLLALINNVDFCNSMGKEPRFIRDPKMALGILGTVGIKQVLPMIIIKNCIRFDCEHFPLLGSKIWSYAVSTGNSTSHILAANGYHNDDSKEYDGFFLGMFSVMGLSITHHLFAKYFEETKIQCLTTLRDENNRELYNAMLTVKADPALIHKLFLNISDTVFSKLVAGFPFGPRVTHLKNAMQSNSRDEGIHTSSLAKAKAFAKFDLLRRSKTIQVKDAARIYLKGSGLSVTESSELIRKDIRRVNLHQL
jgi:HD-like signal output (HDOD) protein